MYKIGNQFISLKDVFSISEISFWDGCTSLVYIKSKQGAETKVTFKAIKEDNCTIMGGVPQGFIDRTKKEIELLLSELQKVNK
jgi:hypothetical protein